MNPTESSFIPLIQQQKDASVMVTRAELHVKVWSAPMVTIAKEFGVSDCGLAKICTRLEVPVPRRGYWAKLQAGKRAPKAPLHAPKPKTPEVAMIQPPLGSMSRAEPPTTRDPTLQARIDAALASAQPVRVLRTLSNPHPIIRKWMDADRHAREQASERFSPVHLSITRTETDRRRLRILTALFREFERIGYSVTAEGEKQRSIVIRSRSACLNFALYEPVRRVRIRLTETEKKDSWDHTNEWRYENQPSGELLLRIESYLGDGERTVWRDKTEIRLEDRIEEAVAGLLTAMALVEDRGEKRRNEEQWRWKLEQERAERERQRKVEVARWKELVDLAESARQAKMVREFLDELERRVLVTAGDQGLSARLQNWLISARKRADAIDPIIGSDFYLPKNTSFDDDSDCAPK